MFALTYAVVSYLGFLATFVYFACFTDGIWVPKHVDSGTPGGLAGTLFVNIGLVLLFGFQHSVMAREGFKRRLTRIIPAHAERATYVLASTLALIILMARWQPMTGVLWAIRTPVLVLIVWTINAIGWLGVPLVSFMIDHFDLFGLKQPFNAFRRTSSKRTGFLTPLLYRYVRHPMMSAIFIALWVTPQMTIGHLLLSVGMSIYIMIGVHFEERSLARDLGGIYRQYQQSTPKFFPLRAPKTTLAAGPINSPS